MNQDKINNEIQKCYDNFIVMAKKTLPKNTQCVLMFLGDTDHFDERFWTVLIYVPCKYAFLKRIFYNNIWNHAFFKRFFWYRVPWDVEYFKKIDKLISNLK